MILRVCHREQNSWYYLFLLQSRLKRLRFVGIFVKPARRCDSPDRPQAFEIDRNSGAILSVRNLDCFSYCTLQLDRANVRVGRVSLYPIGQRSGGGRSFLVQKLS